MNSKHSYPIPFCALLLEMAKVELRAALHRQWQLFHTLCLNGQSDPEPALASRKALQKQLEREFTVKSYSYVT